MSHSRTESAPAQGWLLAAIGTPGVRLLPATGKGRGPGEGKAWHCRGEPAGLEYPGGACRWARSYGGQSILAPTTLAFPVGASSLANRPAPESPGNPFANQLAPTDARLSVGVGSVRDRLIAAPMDQKAGRDHRGRRPLPRGKLQPRPKEKPLCGRGAQGGSRAGSFLRAPCQPREAFQRRITSFSNSTAKNTAMPMPSEISQPLKGRATVWKAVCMKGT